MSVDKGFFHCVKTDSGPHFPAFGLNTERYSVSLDYLSVFSPNAGKYGLEELRIWTLFTQCCMTLTTFVNLSSIRSDPPYSNVWFLSYNFNYRNPTFQLFLLVLNRLKKMFCMKTSG